MAFNAQKAKTRIARALAQNGLKPHAIAGILANLEGESGFNPDNPNPTSGAYGIAQWLGGRKAGLEAHARKMGKPSSNLDVQIGFLLSEIKKGDQRNAASDGEYVTFKSLNAQKNAAAAGRFFAYNFERGGFEGARAAAAKKHVKLARRVSKTAYNGRDSGRTYTWVPKSTGDDYNPFHKPNSRYKAGWHTGNDISAPYGSPIKWAVPTTGKVLWVKDGGDYGLHMLIRDEKGREWLFAHLAGTRLERGDRVEQGEQIAKVGNSGTSYSGTDGAHLHLEQTLPNKKWDYNTNLKDPKLVFGEGRGIPPGDDLKPGDFLSVLGVPRSWLDNPGMEEVADIVDRAARNDWSEQRFMWKLRETDWYIQRTESQRKFDMLQSKDQERQVNIARASIRKTARQFGIDLSDQQVDREALMIARNGDSPEMIQAWVARKYVYDPAKGQSGLTATFQEQLMDMAAEYGVSLSNKRLQRWTRDFIAADAQAEDFEQQVREDAQALFPNLDLKNRTLRDALTPYLQVVQDELGTRIDQVDLTDPKWTEVFDLESGAPMTTWDWKKKLVSDKRYGWDGSEKGRQASIALATAIGSIFGGVR